MKANDLRIKNLVQINDGNKSNGDKWEVYEVDAIYSDWATTNMYYADRGCVKLRRDKQFKIVVEDCIYGIPISEQWLKKFGFDHSLNGWWCSKDLMNVKLSKYGVIEIFLSGSDTDLAFNGIQYVNQLQNLYFALTRQEIELKEEQK